MSYVKLNVNKPTKLSPGAGGDKKNTVTIVDLDDVLTHQPRDTKGIVITGKHVFKEGAYAIKIAVTPSSIATKATPEGEVDEEAVMQEFVFAHPGTEKEIREFRANWLGRDCLIFDESCSDGVINEYGAPCAPMRMSYEATDDKDSKKTVFTFKSVNKGPEIAIYENTLTFSDVLGTIDADENSPNVSAGEGEYQLGVNTVATALTTLIGMVHGGKYTLLGGGGAHPTSIVSAAFFTLKDGTSWSGIAGSSITLMAYKDGASSWMFIELSRT
jgi:hypothetical protein